MIELEKTYLARYLPKDLKNHPKKVIIDHYVPINSPHPKLRLRKDGDSLMLTKKEPKDNDPSVQVENTILLTEQEFIALNQIPGSTIKKTRYYYPYKNRTAEIDVFEGSLKGLIVIDFEFSTEKEKNSFKMPDFCLADITEERFIAGGILCRSTYRDIEEKLKKYNYKKS